MENQQGYTEKTYGEKTSFDQFLDWEDLPVIRNFVVGDIRKLEVTPWRRRGGLGCYIILGHPREAPNSAALDAYPLFSMLPIQSQIAVRRADAVLHS